MQGPARILIVGKSDFNDTLQPHLVEQGFECCSGDITHSASELTGTRRPDVVILNMASEAARQKPDAFLALAKTLKSSALASRMRILLIGADRSPDLGETVADVDDLIVGEASPQQVCHRVRSLVRLNTMHEELVRRLNTSAKYGLDAPVHVSPPKYIENATILVLGDPDNFAIIENALASNATLVGALSSTTALEYLERRAFDAVLINAKGALDPYMEFVSEVRRKSRLFNLPILALASASEFDRIENVYALGITDSLTMPCTTDELRIRVNLLVRESRFRDSLKHIYQEAKHLATSDALTGLYSRGFLMEHVASMVADASRTTQSFTLASISIANIEDINTRIGFAAGDRIIRQVGEVIALLIRGEDLAARYSGPRFMLALPDTPEQRAECAIHRIVGVVAHTEFVVENHMEPVKVELRTTMSGYNQGDTAQSLIERCGNMDLKAAA